MANNRILIVDDNPSIHEDFKKILAPNRAGAPLLGLEERLFGAEAPSNLDRGYAYQLICAVHASQAIDIFCQALETGDPFAVVFADVRLPPGKNGIDMIERIWSLAPMTQVVIMSAFSDYSWEDLIERFGWSDRLIILRKPFDAITIKQLALLLTRRWSSELALLAQREDCKHLAMVKAELERDRQILRAALDQADDAFALLTPTGLIHDCSEALARMVHQPHLSCLGKTISDFVPPEEHARWLTPGLFHACLSRAGAEPLRVEVSVSAVLVDDLKLFLTIIRDQSRRPATGDEN